jgi:quinol monooxygenase YgiN
MSNLEVIARMRIRPGKVEEFRQQAAEMMRLSRERDTRTLRYDWFVDEPHLACEVHELYVDEAGLIEHGDHVADARNALFRDSADDHRMSVYGPISPHMRELFAKHAGGVGAFTFLQGLEAPAAAGR